MRKGTFILIESNNLNQLIIMPPESPPTDGKRCSKCGSSFTGAMVFCTNCGTSLLTISSQKNTTNLIRQGIEITTLPYVMFRANLQHTGEYDFGEIMPTNTELWRFTTKGSVTSSPVLSEGVVYVGSGENNLYAIDAMTGEDKWRFATKDSVTSSPVVSNGVVYVGSRDTNLYAIDAMTGKMKWRFATKGAVTSSPAVSNGVVYFGSEDKNLYAIDAVTGKEQWRFATGHCVDSSPAVSNGVVYVGSRDNNLYAIDAVTGKEQWRFATGDWSASGGSVYSSPAVSNGVVYVGSWNRNLYAIDAVTGKEQWRFATGDRVSSSPAVSNGVVYFGSEDKNLYAIDAVTGQEKWQFATKGNVESSPAVSNGVVYVGSLDKNLYAFGGSITLLFDTLQRKVEKIIWYKPFITGTFTEAKDQIAVKKYDDARQTLKKAEDTINILLKYESSLAVWKTKGYKTTELETIHSENSDELIPIFQQYTKAIYRLETFSQEFKSTKKFYPQLIEQPENARIISSIEQNLKNPAQIDVIENDLQRLNETIRQQVRITKLKEKANKLLAETERLVQVPASIKTDLQSHDEPVLERALKELDSLRANAKPVLAFTFDHTSLIANRWHKIGVPISNTGNSPAFDVTVSFSEEFEVKRVQPITVAAGKTVTLELGVLPKKDGTIPFEIALDYRNATGNPFKETQEFWIDVIEKGMNTSPPSETPSSHVSQFTPNPLTPKQLPPDLFDRYTESEFIGKGGFARVFKAKRKDGKYVAIKIPISMDAMTGKSFIAEMQNWTKLSHPNIVALFDFNIMPMPYFEEELCDGALADQTKPIECEEAAWILFNICEGLKFAHARKIIHRDLKPQNILLKDGMPKISDWGLSRIISESTTTNATSFTPYYAAPEQIGKKAKDERTDIWQLGVILYELVTGELPFQGDSMIEIGMNIATKDPKRPGEIKPDANVIDAVVMKCLKKDHAKRYQSVLELQKDLAMYMRENYAELLITSVSVHDYNRSAYYCGDLVMINILTGDLKSAYKYLVDLEHYSKGNVKVEAKELSEQIKMRMEMGVTEIPDELIQKAEIIVHQVSVGFRKKG